MYRYDRPSSGGRYRTDSQESVSGVYTGADDTDIEPVGAGTCPLCDGTPQLTYQNGRATVECPDCESLLVRSPVPPIVVRQTDTEELPQVVSDFMLAQFQAISSGFCVQCGGRLDSTLTVDTEYDPLVPQPLLDVTSECRACGSVSHQNVGILLFDNPAVGAFLLDTDFDPLSTYFWEQTYLHPEATLLEEDPVRVELRFAASDEELELVVDADCTVLEADGQTR